MFSRIWIFIRQVIAELKKVIWPTRNELWTYFWVVIIFVMILMTAIFLFDYFFAWVTNLVFA
ncbi:MAG: preprotein translocase subunit SecE [Actinomycetaceae bacterium]|nr:preprotein translocase subunit SecE [Actinomycetaceae bacterium]